MDNIVLRTGDETLTNLWNNVISRGVVNRRLDSSRLGLLLSAIASEMNTSISIINTYMNQFNINTCTDKVMIENMARLFAVRRLSSKSKVILEFFRLTPNSETIKIPAGFKVGSTTDSKIAFRTISDAYLWKGTQSVTVMAYSISSGARNNVDAGVLNKFAPNNYNTIIGVINPEPAFGGYDNESIESLRSRASGFRYNRDGSKSNVQELLYQNGIPQYRYSLQEYNDGPGSFLICIDTTSDAEFEDVQRAFTYRHFGIQRFFAANCVVGADLNVGRLKASILSELSDYEIENIELSFDQGVVINKQNIIAIPDTYRVFPNKVITDINYDGEFVTQSDEDDDDIYLFEG